MSELRTNESDFWNRIAPTEELDVDDERINRELRWNEIERHLGGVRTILDVGGGTGAFSVALAKRGFEVTHLDISPDMIRAARDKATGLHTIAFVEASAHDLSLFPDRHFDLVLNTDGAISFSGDRALTVLSEACRVTRRKLIVSVSNKACMIPTWLKYSLKAAQRILPAVHEMMRSGSWNKDQFPDNALIYPSMCDIPALKCFTPDELTCALRACGMDVVTTRALGSLTHLLLPHGNVADLAAVEGLVELCESFDTDVMPHGPGSFRRAGLLAIAEPAATPA